MVKTQSQTGKVAIKKEEEEDCKPSLGLMNIRNTRSSGRIAKRNSPIMSNISLPAQQVKVEEDTDTKALLQSPLQYPKVVKKQTISQEQINQLIDYIANDNMSASAAASKVNISKASGFIYYNVYKNDPEKKIPVPRNKHTHPRKYYTQEQIGNLIKCIDNDKMTIKEASTKANMPYTSAHQYYTRYLKDPNHAIPVQKSHQRYTQEQKSKFINYIVNDKMNIKAASKKAKMTHGAAQMYYYRYFKEENPDIPAPSHIAVPKRSTQEQLNEAMGYIINGKMSVTAASRKANACYETTRRRYRQYLIDNNMKVPAKRVVKRYTQDQINEFIGYIVDDNMSIKAASKKANMSCHYGTKYYHQYLKDRNIDGLA